MTELAKQIVWPLNIQPVNELGYNPQSGITRAAYLTGAEIRRTYQTKALESFTAKFFLSPLLDNYEDDMVWFKWLEKGTASFLFMDPHRSVWPNDVIGVGDGTRTTWVLPYVNWLGDPMIYSDGAYDDAVTVYSDGPNLLNFNQSVGNFGSMEFREYGTAVITKSIEQFIIRGCYNRGVTKIVNTLLVNAFVYSPLSIVPLEIGDTVVMLCDVMGKSSVESCAVINASVGATGYLTDGEWSVQETSFQATVATNVGGFGGGIANTSGTAYVGAMIAARGDINVWYPGSLRMPVVVFDSAPAAGAVISSRVDRANKMLRMVCRSVSHAIKPDGNRFVTVKMQEVPE